MNLSFFKKNPIKRIFLSVLAVFIVLLCLNIFTVVPFDENEVIQVYRPNNRLEEISADLSTYDMEVEFYPDTKKLRCIQNFEYINNTRAAHDRLYFHIYPNAFKYETKVPFPQEDMTQAYPNGFSPGSIDLISVKLDGSELGYSIGGYSEEILEVHLVDVIAPDQTVKLTIEFEVALPNSLGRFGYGNYTFNITNWYPILCVYDKEGWSTYPYFPIGDPFYSDVANYNVRISVPEDYHIACTGDILSITQKGNKKIWEIRALAVRDFAFVVSDRFMVDSKKVGNTTIYSYYITPKGGKKALTYAADAIKIFNRQFGKYPYNQFSVVESDFYIGGMEYPNLVLIDKSLYLPEAYSFLEIVTVHETAHQWWYGVVGNNQIEEAWLDEGLTEYSTLIYFKHRYGQKTMDRVKASTIGKGKYALLSEYAQDEDIDETIAKPLYSFSDWIVYDLLVYGKGAMLFEALEEKVGEKVFYEILKEYYNENAFKNATLTELLYACEKVTGGDYTDFFNDWLYDEKN